MKDKFNYNQFNRDWNEQFSLLPELALLPYEEREKWKSFSCQIVQLTLNKNKKEIEDYFNDGYDEGYQDAQLDMKQEILAFIEKVMGDEDELGEGQRYSVLNEIHGKIKRGC